MGDYVYMKEFKNTDFQILNTIVLNKVISKKQIKKSFF